MGDSDSENELSEESVEDINDDICHLCKKPFSEETDNSVICDKCPQAFHLSCKMNMGKFHGKTVRSRVKRKSPDEEFSRVDLGLKCTKRRKKLEAEEVNIKFSKKSWKSSRRAQEKKRVNKTWDYEWVEVSGNRFLCW
eukprot:UN03914